MSVVRNLRSRRLRLSSTGGLVAFFTNMELLDPGTPRVCVNATKFVVLGTDWSWSCLSWVPLLTLTDYGYPLYFADPDAFNQPRRFYRAVPVP